MRLEPPVRPYVNLEPQVLAGIPGEPQVLEAIPLEPRVRPYGDLKPPLLAGMLREPVVQPRVSLRRLLLVRKSIQSSPSIDARSQIAPPGRSGIILRGTAKVPRFTTNLAALKRRRLNTGGAIRENEVAVPYPRIQRPMRPPAIPGAWAVRSSTTGYVKPDAGQDAPIPEYLPKTHRIISLPGKPI